MTHYPDHMDPTEARICNATALQNLLAGVAE